MLAGRGREAEALLHTRTYDEEAAEALEAVGAPKTADRGAHDRRSSSSWSSSASPIGLSLFGGGGRGHADRRASAAGRPVHASSSAPASTSAAALGVLGLIAGFAFSDRPFWAFLGQTVWNPSSSFVLVAVPLFLLMGEILLRAGLSDRLYKRAQRLARPAARRAAAHQHRGVAACSRRSPAPPSRPPPPWARWRCRSSRARATTRRWCSARSRPAARSATSSRPASPSSSTR